MQARTRVGILAIQGDVEAHRRAVERGGHLLRGGVESSHDLRDVLGVEAPVAGVLALGGEGEVDVLADPEARSLEHRCQHLARRTRPGRGLEHHQRLGPEVGQRRLGRREDVAEVRLAVLAERCGHADELGLALGQAGGVGGGEGTLGADAPALYRPPGILSFLRQWHVWKMYRSLPGPRHCRKWP